MQHWDSFWATTKSLNSFAEGEHSQGYIGGIADFWQVEFSGFPKSASILDLATGNGGLAVLAQQYDSNFNISASDSASIDPLSRFSSSSKNYQLLKKISFFSNMNSESLTFLQDQFDRVISQFGFEYAKPELALSEINRVLKYNGEFIALVHHRDSLISIDCRIGLAILNKMNDLLSQLQEFGSLCQKIIYKNEPTAEQQIQFKDKNATLLRLFKEMQSNCNTDEELSWCNLLLKELLPIIIDWKNTNSERVNKACEDLHSFELRLQDQQAASWSYEDIEDIKKLAKENWTSCEFDIITLDTGILCWIFKALK